MNRERESGKKTQGSWNDSEERDSERVMAGGRGASSFCQDRGRTRVGKEGEKLSSVTPETLLSSQESAVCRLMCVSTLVLWCTLRWQVWEPVSGSSGCPWLRLGGRDFWCDSPKGSSSCWGKTACLLACVPGLLAPNFGWSPGSEAQLDELWHQL